MIKLLFNPFSKEFDDIQAADLDKLRNVAEGWYMEYKVAAVTTKNIAKSLAAFANHYGGWVFYGIKEKDDGSHFAGSFPGIDESGAITLINDLKNAAKDVITPSPYYEYRKLDGPCEEIGLSNGKSIIMVGVPSGPDSPYIHNDGKIYRRIADSSDPKPEIDKTVLDNLWFRRQKAREKLEAFLSITPTLSKGEENLPWLDIFLIPDPLGYASQSVKLKFDDFVNYLMDPPDPKPNMYVKFDNFFAMADGMIARYIFDNDPYNFTLTWKLYHNGSSIISIPFANFSVDEIKLGNWLSGYLQETAFINFVERNKLRSSFVIDLNLLLSVAISILGQNRDLLVKSGIHGSYFVKAALHNVWRKIPFIDTKLYMDFIERHGIPILQYGEEYSPPGKTFESLVQLQDIGRPATDQSEKSDLVVIDVGRVLRPIFNCLGLPLSAVFVEDNDVNEENSLIEAGNRAMLVGNNRRLRYG